MQWVGLYFTYGEIDLEILNNLVKIPQIVRDRRGFLLQTRRPVTILLNKIESISFLLSKE